MKQILTWVSLAFLALAVILWMLGKGPDVFIALLIAIVAIGIGYTQPDPKGKRDDG